MIEGLFYFCVCWMGMLFFIGGGAALHFVATKLANAWGLDIEWFEE